MTSSSSRGTTETQSSRQLKIIMPFHLFCSQNLASDIPIILGEILKKHQNSHPSIEGHLNYRIIVPDSQSVRDLEQLLLQMPQLNGILANKNILTFESFMGVYLEEEGEIPSLSPQWLLRQIWQATAERNALHDFDAESLFSFTHSLREEGYSSKWANRFAEESDKILAQHWETLWNIYDDILNKEKTLWDLAKLEDHFIKSLKKQENQSLKQLTELYFLGFSWARPSLKNCLMALNEFNPQLNTVLWLNSEKQNAQDFVLQDWEEFAPFLKAQFEQSQHAQQSALQCTIHESVFSEATHVLKQIDSLLLNNCPAHEILILLPENQFYKNYFSSQLRHLGFGSGCTLKQSLGKFFNKIDDSEEYKTWKNCLQQLRYYEALLSENTFSPKNLENLSKQILISASANLGFESIHGVQIRDWNTIGLKQFKQVFAFSFCDNFEKAKQRLWGKKLPLVKYKSHAASKKLDLILNMAKENLHFSWSQLDAQGKVQSPSSLISHIPTNELKTIPQLFSEQKSQNHSLVSDYERFHHWQDSHEYAGYLKSIQLPKKSIYTATQIEDFTECPFIYLGKNVFKLKEREEESLQPSASDKGNLLHGFLEHFFKKNAELIFQALYQSTLRSELLTSLESEWIEFGKRLLEKDSLLLIPLFEAFQKKAISALQEVLQYYWNLESKVEQPLKPLFFEWSFKNEDALILKNKTHQWRIEGKIDRIDANLDTGEFIVYDYKSGDLASLNNEMKAYKKVQLPFYALAAKQLLLKHCKKAPVFLGALAIDLKKLSFNTGMIPEQYKKRFSKRGGTGILYKSEELEHYWENLENEIVSKIEKIEAQDFRFAPEKCKEFCKQRDYCRYYAKS